MPPTPKNIWFGENCLPRICNFDERVAPVSIFEYIRVTLHGRAILNSLQYFTNTTTFSYKIVHVQLSISENLIDPWAAMLCLLLSLYSS